MSGIAPSGIAPWHGYTAPPSLETRACNCIGPQGTDPVCPCMMPGYLQRKAGAVALEIMSRMVNKPRIRVKAGSRHQ